MKFLSILAGATTIALLALPVFAADYLGMTHYIFDQDAPGVTSCCDECAANWRR